MPDHEPPPGYEWQDKRDGLGGLIRRDLVFTDEQLDHQLADLGD